MFFPADKNPVVTSGRHLADLTTIGKPSTSISGFGILYLHLENVILGQPLVLN